MQHNEIVCLKKTTCDAIYECDVMLNQLGRISHSILQRAEFYHFLYLHSNCFCRPNYTKQTFIPFKEEFKRIPLLQLTMLHCCI